MSDCAVCTLGNTRLRPQVPRVNPDAAVFGFMGKLHCFPDGPSLTATEKYILTEFQYHNIKQACSVTGTASMGSSNYVIVQSTFVGLATVLVAMRVFVRTVVVKRFGLDDTIMVLALVNYSATNPYFERNLKFMQILSLVVCAMTSLTVHYSGLYLTGHYSTKSEALEYITTALKWSSIAAPIGILSGLCTRISVCLFLLRIFGTKKAWRSGLYTIMVFATIVVIPTIVSLLAQCSPVRKLWNPRLPGSCWLPRTVVDIGYFNGCEYPSAGSLSIEK